MLPIARSTEAVDKQKEANIREYARQAASNIVLRGKGWSPQAKHDSTRRRKYQTALTNEEAAEVDAIHAAICPEFTRYALVRYLLLEFCDVARGKIRLKERTGIWG